MPMHPCASMCKQPTLAPTLTCSRPPHGRAHEETHRHSKPAAVVAVLRCEHLEDHKLCVLRPWGVEYGCSLCHKAQAAAAYTARVAGTAAHAKAEVCAHTHRQASASDENRRRGKNNFNKQRLHTDRQAQPAERKEQRRVSAAPPGAAWSPVLWPCACQGCVAKTSATGRLLPTAATAVDYPVVESQFCFSAHPYCGARRKWDFGVRVRVRMCV